jgi:hypothetical protein
MSHDPSWVHTYSGKKVYPLNAKPEDIAIADIAHALSLQCRFTGHTRYFYSVAQHSLLVSLLLHDQAKPDHICLWGLLHDASEAYLIDVARPVKHLPEFHAYRQCEKDLMAVICQKFELPTEMPPAVHEADQMALSIEAHQLMGDVSEWDLVKPDTRYRIMPQAPIDVEYEFRSIFGGLYGS